MKLTITGRVDTIVGVMRKLDICDAKFNINDGFTVDLDGTPSDIKSGSAGLVSEEVDLAHTVPKKRGRRRKQDTPVEKKDTGENKQTGYKVTCKLCCNQFLAPHPRQSFCPECISIYGDAEACRDKLRKVNEVTAASK